MSYLVANVKRIQALLDPPTEVFNPEKADQNYLNELPQTKKDYEDNLAAMEKRQQDELDKQEQALKDIQLKHQDALNKQQEEFNFINSQLQAEVEEKERKREEFESLSLFVMDEKEKELKAADQRHKTEKAVLEEELAALKVQHDKTLQQFAGDLETALARSWQKYQEKEKARLAVEAAKFRKEAEANRSGLREEGEMGVDKLRALLAQYAEGTLSEAIINALWSTEACLNKLTDLWAAKGALLAGLFPHELINDADFNLDIEVNTILVARICLVTLKIRTCPVEQILNTGWNLTTMNRLKAGLVLYIDGKPLSSLRVGVEHICDMLQEALNSRQPIQQTPFIPSFVSSTSTYSPSLTPHNDIGTTVAEQHHQQQPVQHPESINIERPGPTNFSMPMTVEQAPVVQEHIGLNVAFQPASAPSNDALDIPMDDVISQSTTRIQPQNASKPACRAMVSRGFCKFGHRCRFSHNDADVSQAKAESRQETTKFGDIDMADEPNSTQHPTSAPKNPCFIAQADGWCSNMKCRYFHPPNTHPSTIAPPSHSTMTNHPPPLPPLAPYHREFAPQPPLPGSAPSTLRLPTSLTPCKFEARNGSCRRANKGCKFLHKLPPLPPPGRPLSPIGTAAYGYDDEDIFFAEEDIAPRRNTDRDSAYARNDSRSREPARDAHATTTLFGGVVRNGKERAWDDDELFDDGGSERGARGLQDIINQSRGKKGGERRAPWERY